MKSKLYSTETARERALLIALAEKGGAEEAEASVDELAALADGAGAEVCGRVVQYRESPEKRALLGKGKVAEVKEFCDANEIDVIISDNELTGMQIKNLTDDTGCRVIDRAMLILDIFARRAASGEGKLQAEAAQIKYALPRLAGINRNMDKLRAGAAGVGMRGPGEKKIETDKRLIRARVLDLDRRIAQLERERGTRRLMRAGSGVKRVALVGYTNSGKSTLLNLLSGADVLAEDRLFATLDPVTRKVFADGDGGRYYTLTDTVGFISRLPHEFIAAFKGTLEEAREADLLLRVADCSDPRPELRDEVVSGVLKEMGIADKATLRVYNKLDKSPDFTVADPENEIAVSAKTGAGISRLEAMILEKLRI